MNDNNTLPPCDPLPHTGWIPRLEGLPIVTNFEDTLYTHCSAPGILKTWRTRRFITPVKAQTIAWTATKKALDSVSQPRKIYVVKQVSKREATGIEMMRRRVRTHDHCPRCMDPEETHSHIIHCQHGSAINQRRLSIDKLQLFLDKIDTPEDISHAICEQLLLWQSDPNNNHKWSSITTIDSQRFIEAQ